MKDVTNNLYCYLEAKRHLWNTYYINKVKNLRECSPLDDFEEIDKLLFSSLVLSDFNKVMPPDFVFGKDHFSYLKVFPRYGVEQLMLTISDPRIQGPRKWDNPKEVRIDSSIQLNFIEFFEWDRYNFVNYPYFLVKIVESNILKNLVEKEALIETTSAKVFYIEC